jgi:integrase
MARPRQDGTLAREVNRRKLTDLFVSSRKAQERPELIWDLKQPGLALSVRPSSKKAWKVIYRFHGRPRWLHLGDARAIGLADARRLAARVMLDVAEGKDPGAERRAERLTGTFTELASQYVELHARKHNKSWRQAEALVRRHLLPRWGKLKATAITRADVRAVMIRIDAPIVANQTLAAASAIFSWAIKQEILTVNPCKLVDRNPTTDRERVLSDEEVRLLWEKLDPALKLILLTGQRPGEVAAMQREHIIEDWWQMPGKPQGAWPGTKNGRDHRVALSEPAQALIGSPLAQSNRSGKLLKALKRDEFSLNRFGIERSRCRGVRGKVA